MDLRSLDRGVQEKKGLVHDAIGLFTQMPASHTLDNRLEQPVGLKASLPLPSLGRSLIGQAR